MLVIHNSSHAPYLSLCPDFAFKRTRKLASPYAVVGSLSVRFRSLAGLLLTAGTPGFWHFNQEKVSHSLPLALWTCLSCPATVHGCGILRINSLREAIVMIVDIYTHIMPPEFLKSMEGLGSSSGLVKRMAAIRELHDLDARFRAMDEFGEYRQIFSIPKPTIETVTTPEQGRELARIANDAMAEMVHRHPLRFPTFIAALPLHSVDSALEELKRAIDTLGARGIQIFTHVNGRPLDDPQYEPIFAAMAKYDLPIWLHPARTAAMT